jgi:uncharacterized protein (DUF433 family)
MPQKILSPAEVLDYSDPREVPAYSVGEVAHYLCMPKTTVRAWVSGTRYTSRSGDQKPFKNVVDLPKPGIALLSFFNLVEVHALRSLRVHHNIELQKIRLALDFVKERFGWDRPLIHQGFMTDGVSLFVEHLGNIIDVAADGQMVIREVMNHLKRIEWESSIAARLYPFTRLNIEDAPMSVFIDPRHSFGRPILRDARVATAVIATRYKSGDSMDDLALDYGCSRLEIEEAVRCELPLRAAA